MDEILETYIKHVESGEVISGLHLKNAVKRFQKDLTNPKWVYDQSKVDKVIKFIAKLKHFTGKYSKKPFLLEPWQVFIVSNIYGFYNQDGTRRFQTAYLEMARKQGKTCLVAALSLYHLVADGEDGAEILFAANSKEQARIGFKMVHAFAAGYDKTGKRLKKYRTDINYPETNSFIKTLSAEASKLDGYNCSFGVIDEYHSAKDSQVRDVLKSSQGMRVNPLLVTITTAGFNKSLPCYELRTMCVDIIAGIKQDDSLFSVIYALDENDDWQDKLNWVKSNPNLGITVNESFIKGQVVQATNNPNDEVGVKTKNLNIWCDSAAIWIPDKFVVEATTRLDVNDFKGCECYIGVDLAANVDLTAVSYLFIKDDIYYFFIDYYIPQDTLKVRNLHADKSLYIKWALKKYLKTTPGNVTDYDYITRDMLAISETCDIKAVYYDKYNANAWAIQCTEEGLPMTPFSQVIANFNKCTKEFERLILSGKVRLADNPITRYCLRNVELRMDFNGNVKPLKNSESKKIDGVIAALQSVAAYLEAIANYKGIAIY